MSPLIEKELERKIKLLRRNRHLALFGLLVAPLTLGLIIFVSTSIKDLIIISFLIENKLENNNSLIPGFTVFSYLNKITILGKITF